MSICINIVYELTIYYNDMLYAAHVELLCWSSKVFANESVYDVCASFIWLNLLVLMQPLIRRYMMGNGISIFPIMMLGMLFWKPIQTLWDIKTCVLLIVS